MLADTPNTGIKHEFSFTKDVNVVSAVCMAHAHTHILFRKSSSLSSHSNCCACQDMITFRSESSLIRALFMVMWRLWNTQQHTGWRLITGNWWSSICRSYRLFPLSVGDLPPKLQYEPAEATEFLTLSRCTVHYTFPFTLFPSTTCRSHRSKDAA